MILPYFGYIFNTNQSGWSSYSPDFPSQPGDPGSTPAQGNQQQKNYKKIR